MNVRYEISELNRSNTSFTGSPRRQARLQAAEDEIRETFLLFSQDTGILSNYVDLIDANKLEVCMRSVGYEPSREQVNKMIAQLDTTNKGAVTLEEFSKILRHTDLSKDFRTEASSAFRKINTDKSGKISFGNMKKILGELGENLNDEQIKEMINAADKDGDGQVSYPEFMDMMHQAKVL